MKIENAIAMSLLALVSACGVAQPGPPQAQEAQAETQPAQAETQLAGITPQSRSVRFNGRDLDATGWTVLQQIEAATRSQIRTATTGTTRYAAPPARGVDRRSPSCRPAFRSRATSPPPPRAVATVESPACSSTDASCIRATPRR